MKCTFSTPAASGAGTDWAAVSSDLLISPGPDTVGAHPVKMREAHNAREAENRNLRKGPYPFLRTAYICFKFAFMF